MFSGSQSGSDSLDSSDPNDGEMDEEMSKVVGDFGFAIEREKPPSKEVKRETNAKQDDVPLRQMQEEALGQTQGQTLGQTQELVRFTSCVSWRDL